MVILAKDLSKTYRIPRRKPGIINGLKSIVHREYDEILALDKVSFQIDEGELVGYIGPNEAGKSTTIKILSGILTPSSGECKVLARFHTKIGLIMLRILG